MTQRWLCISTRANDEITKKRKVWGVAKRYVNTIKKVRKGDTLLMYTMQEIIEKEIIPSAVTTIYEVTSDVFYKDNHLFEIPKGMGNEQFPFRINVKSVKIFKDPIQFKPLIPMLSFIKNKKMWSGSIRTAMRLIPEEDYQLIISARS